MAVPAQRTWTSILVKLSSSQGGRGVLRLAHMAIMLLVGVFLLTRAMSKSVYVDFRGEIFEFLFLAALFLVMLLALLPRRLSEDWQSRLRFVEIFLLQGVAHFSHSPAVFTVVLLLQVGLFGFELGKTQGALLGLWASACFNFFLIAGDHSGQVVLFQLLTNNLTLVGAGFFSGLLKEQLNSLTQELRARDQRIGLLQQLNSLIVQNIPIGILTLDRAGLVLQSNAAAASIFDWVNFNSANLSAAQVLPHSPLDDWLQGAAPKHAVELELRHPESEELKVLKVSITPISGAQKEVGFLLGVEDLTKVKELELTMRQSEKLAAVGQLAAGIAHEIRNPLASISGSVQMLEGLASSSEDGAKLIKIILREIDRLNNMITEFLDFVKPESSSLQPMDLSELVVEVTELLKVDPSLSQAIHMSVEVEPSVWIKGDRDKLKQAFLNIMINACQAMEKVEQPKLIVRSVTQAGLVSLEVQDNGMGMDEKTQKRIFEPFLTTKPKGTGLGLSVTHRIIENHQGRIHVQSTPNAGSVFRLEFPVWEPGQKGSALSGSSAV